MVRSAAESLVHLLGHRALLICLGLFELAEVGVEGAGGPAITPPLDALGGNQQLNSHVYFVVSEALANVAKYAQARSATVTVAREADRVVAEVADDGVGGADLTSGSGLRGLSDRVAAPDGKLEVRSPPGGGTCLRAELPL